MISTQNDATKPKRKTPTERQIEELTQLNDDDLVETALDSIFALNRRAKKLRDTRKEYRRASFADSLEFEISAIYTTKDRFLAALALAGRAKVSVYELTRTAGYSCCNRSWWGSSAKCRRCGGEGSPKIETKKWYLVDCGGHYRFHQPQVPDEVAALATPMEPHDPTQPQREIPEIDLTIEAQKTCVRIATERLKTAMSGKAA